jgi:hypothetical protein
MKCPRCGRRMEAGWYCAHCGQALPDINVADRPAAGTSARWIRLLAVVAVVAVALAALTALRLVRAGSQRVALVPSTTPTAPVVAGAPTAAPEVGTAVVAPSPRIVTATAASQSGTAAPQPGAGPTATVGLGQPVWRIPLLTRQPRLDGVLDEWRTTPLDISAVVFGQRYWDDARDLSAQAVGGYDRELLFLGVRVTDDIFSQPGQGVRLYLGDSLELQVDADRNGDRERATYDADDFQLGISPGNFADHPPEAFVWRPTGETAAGITVASRRLDDGYVVEAAIPWRLFRVDPEATPTLGFALNVSDNDLPERAQLTMVSSTPNRSWGDPRTFGTLVLEPPGAAPGAPTAQQGPPP